MKRISKKRKIYDECISIGINLPKPYEKLSKKIECIYEFQ